MKSRRGTFVTGLALLLALPLAAQVDTGAADFTNYVSLGDSLTAGFMSGSLHLEGQAVSYPSLIHLQATAAAGFEQPLVSDPGIPNVLTLQGLVPLVILPKPGQGLPLNLDLPRPYNNMAVPGATANDVVATRTGGLHDLVLRGLGTQLELAVALQPTFATLWIGSNDVLGAATSGIVIDGVTLTRTADFERDLRRIVGVLGPLGVSGWAIGTIPSVTGIPFVTTLPPVVVDPATSEPVIINGQPVPLIGPQGPLGLADNVLLTASAFLANGIGIPTVLGGTGQPLPDEVVLSAAEASTIEGRRAELNAVIRSVASEGGGVLVDLGAIFDQVNAQGILLGGVELTTDFLTGGLFTYDGVHPAPVGHAIIANAFIDAINSSFGAAIPKVALAAFTLGDLARFPGVGGSGGGSQFVFTKRAYKSLRTSLGIPSARKLKKMKRRLERRGGQAGVASAKGQMRQELRRLERQRQREMRRALAAG